MQPDCSGLLKVANDSSYSKKTGTFSEKPKSNWAKSSPIIWRAIHFVFVLCGGGGFSFPGGRKENCATRAGFCDIKIWINARSWRKRGNVTCCLIFYGSFLKIIFSDWEMHSFFSIYHFREGGVSTEEDVRWGCRRVLGEAFDHEFLTHRQIRAWSVPLLWGWSFLPGEDWR